MFISKLARSEDVRLLDVEEKLQKQIKTSLNTFAIKNNINSGSLSAMLKGKRAIPLRLVSRNVITESTRWVLKNANIPVTIPKRLTSDLGYLVGVLRDGTVNHEIGGEWNVSFYSMDKKYLEIIQHLVKKLFGVEQRIEKFDQVSGVRIRSKTLFLFFTLLFEAKRKQEEWNTPRLIQKSSRDVKIAYITGFFDAEGGIPHLEKMKNPSRKNLYVKFVQKNKESLEFIKHTLESENIKMGKVYFSDNKYVVKVSTHSIPLFSQLIIPHHSVKAKRLFLLTRLLPHL